jgi:hypothetical protein
VVQPLTELKLWPRFKLRKAKAARNRIVTVALNIKKKELRKAGKL